MDKNENDGPPTDPAEQITIRDVAATGDHHWAVFATDAEHQQDVEANHHAWDFLDEMEDWGDHAQDTAQQWSEHAGDHLLDARNEVQAWGDHTQETVHDWGTHITDGVNDAQHYVDHVHDVVTSLHEDRNAFNECPAEQPVSIGPMNVDADPHLEHAAIDGRGMVWEQRPEELNVFHDGAVFNHSLGDGRGQYECEYDAHEHYQPGGTFNYQPYDHVIGHGVADVIPHLFDDHYTQPDLTTVVSVGHFQADAEAGYTPPHAAPHSFDSTADHSALSDTAWGNHSAESANHLGGGFSAEHPSDFHRDDHGTPHTDGYGFSNQNWGGFSDINPHGPELFSPHGPVVDDVNHHGSFPAPPDPQYTMPDFAGHGVDTPSVFDHMSHADAASQFHQEFDFHDASSAFSSPTHFDTDHSGSPSFDTSHFDGGFSFGDAFHDGGSFDSGLHDSGSYDGSSHDGGSHDGGSYDSGSHDGGSFDDGGSVDDSGGVD